MEQLLAQQLLEAGKVVEAQLDSEIKRLDKLAANEDDLEVLRERRLQAIKNDAIKKQVWFKFKSIVNRKQWKIFSNIFQIGNAVIKNAFGM